MKSKLISTLFFFIVLSFHASLFAQWRTIEAPNGIIQSFGAATEDKLFLPGGLGGAGYVSTVAVYDINADTWSEMPLSVPRTMIAAAINGELLFCAGGINFDTSEEFSAIEIYNTTTNEPIGLAELSIPRIVSSAVSVGNKILFAGGGSATIDGPDLIDFEVFSRVDIYDVTTDTWSTAELSDPRTGMAHAVLGNKAYFAGGDKGNGIVSNVVDIYDVSTDTWTTETLSLARSFYGGGGSFKGEVYFAGGTTVNSETTTQIDIYDPITNTWRSEQMVTPRGGVQIGTTENHILFAGGASESNLVEWQSEASSNIVDIYNVEIDDWDIYEMEVQRINHAVLSAQDQVFIIGGVDLSTFQLHASIDVFRGKQLDYEGIVSDKSPDNTYTIATLKHLKEAFRVNYQIENIGKLSLNNITVTFDVKKNGAIIKTETKTIDLPVSGDNQAVNYSYLPDEIGVYEIVVSTKQPNIESIFYTDTKTFEISNSTLAKDDGGADDGFSFGFVSPAHYGYFGTEYELLTTDILSAVSTIIVPFPGFSDPTATFYCLIKAVDAEGNIQEENIYKSESLVAGDYFKEDASFATIELPTPITLEAGRYVFAFGQDDTTGMVAFGLDYSKPDAGYWEKNSFEETDWEKSTLPFTLMIRPHFGASDIDNPTANEQWNKIASSIIPLGHQANTIKTVNDNISWLTTFGVISATEFESSILKSLDGGISWEVVNTPELPKHHPTDIAPINESIAYVGMLDAGPDTEDGSIADGLYKTNDGGQSWTRLENYPYSPVYIHFFNEQEGWVMGEAEDFVDGKEVIMSTTNDGGQSWSHAGGVDWTIPEGRTLPLQAPNEEVGFLGDAFTGAYDVVGNSIIIGTTNSIWLSSDKGQNWSRIESPLFTNDTLFTAVVGMKDEQTFMIASALESFELLFSPPKAYATTDGGTTWIESNPSVYPADLAYLPDTEHSFILSGHFEFAPQFGTIGTERTDDLQNWEYVDDKAIVTMAFAENKGVGLFGNFPNLGTTGNIYNWGEAVIPTYDAAINRASQYKYTEVTLNQLEEEVILSYAVQSIGLESLANTTFHFEVLKDGVSLFQDSAIIANIDTTAATAVNFSYLPDEIGVYEFVVTASQTDLGNNFFQDVQTLNVNETTLNKDDGSPESGISLQFITPNHYGYLGTEFTLINPDQVRAMTMLIIPDTLSDFHILIKEVDENGNAKAGEIYKSAPISGLEATAPGFVYTHIFEAPIDLEPGTYIFAVGQDQPISGPLVYGFDTDRVDESFWIYNPLDSAVWERGVNGTLMFRIHLGDFVSTSTEDYLAETTPLKVFPVPFQESLYIQLEYPVEPTARLQLFDIAGKLWADREINHQQLIRQDFQELPKGMYFLRLRSGQYLRTVKVLKQ